MKQPNFNKLNMKLFNSKMDKKDATFIYSTVIFYIILYFCLLSSLFYSLIY